MMEEDHTSLQEQCCSDVKTHRARPSAIPAAHASAAVAAASRRCDLMRSYTNFLGPLSVASGATSASSRPFPPLRLMSCTHILRRVQPSAFFPETQRTCILSHHLNTSVRYVALSHSHHPIIFLSSAIQHTRNDEVLEPCCWISVAEVGHEKPMDSVVGPSLTSLHALNS